MKILLVNHYAGSLQYGMEYRPFYLAREWVSMGHQVTIVGASYSHVRLRQPQVRHGLTKESIDGVNYLWLRTPAYSNNGLGRAGNIFAFVAQLYQYSHSFIVELAPDVMIASSTYPLDVLPVSWIAHQSGATFIYEVHDLWPLSPIELGGMSPRHPFISLMQFAENYGYRHAKHVVSMLPLTASYMQAHGMAPEKFVHVPNGISIDSWVLQPHTLPKQHVQVLDYLRQQGHFIVGYTGAHGLANALDALIEVAQSLSDKSVAIVLVGRGTEKNRLMKHVQDIGLTNILFLPPVPKNAIPALLDKFDALYIGLKSKPLFRYGVSPNKLMDYMMAAKPIIYAIDAGNDVVTESGCGISVPAENQRAITDAIVKLMNLSDLERRGMGVKGRNYVIMNHNYGVLAQEFLKMISK